MNAVVRAATVVATLSSLCLLGSAQSYSIKDLGINYVDPGTSTHLNNAGQALVSAVGGPYRVTGAQIEKVPGFSASALTFGANIAQNGAVLGNSEIATFQNRGLVYTSGTPTQLPTLQGDSYAYAMNASGMIVGQSFKTIGGAYGNQSVSRAVIYSGGGITELPVTNAAYASATALSINAAGIVVGSADVSANGTLVGRAAMWTSGNLSILPLLDASHIASRALKVNDDGSVLINASGTGVSTRAAILRNGVYTTIPELGTGSGAFTMNSNGDVIGTSRLLNGNLASYLWTATGGLTDLNALIVGDGSVYSQFQGFDINDSGQIIGVARQANFGDYRALVLTPQAVPEPGVFAGLGLGVLALVRRRRLAK